MSYPINMDQVTAKLREWQETSSRKEDFSRDNQPGKGHCRMPASQTSYLKLPYRMLDSPPLGKEPSEVEHLASGSNGGSGNVPLGLLPTSELRDTAERPLTSSIPTVKVCEGDKNGKPGKHSLRRVNKRIGPLPHMAGDYLTGAESHSRYKETLLIYYAAVSGQAKRLMDEGRKDEADRLARASLPSNRPQHESGLLNHANRLNHQQVTAILNEQSDGNAANMVTRNPNNGKAPLANPATLAPKLLGSVQQKSCLIQNFPYKTNQSDRAGLQGASEARHPQTDIVPKDTRGSGSHTRHRFEQWLDGLPDHDGYDEM